MSELEKKLNQTGIKDSGQRRTFTSGAQRDRVHGKGRYILVPSIPIFLISRIFEDGALKYAARNWEQGMPIGEYVDSALRHLEKYKAGLRDEPHLTMAGWNVVCALWTAVMVYLRLRPRELFDIPNHTPFSAGNEPLSRYEISAVDSFFGADEGKLKGSATITEYSQPGPGYVPAGGIMGTEPK